MGALNPLETNDKTIHSLYIQMRGIKVCCSNSRKPPQFARPGSTQKSGSLGTKNIFESDRSSGKVLCGSFWASFEYGGAVRKYWCVPKPACRSHLISCLLNFVGKRGWMLAEFACYWSIWGAHSSCSTATRERRGASNSVVFCHREFVSHRFANMLMLSSVGTAKLEIEQ